MHKGYEVRMTPSEQDALKDALINTYTECRCTPVLECAGHKFLSEHDRKLSRVDRLLFVRRTLVQWQRAEFTGKCKMCGAHAEHNIGADRCTRCALGASMASEPSEVLPTEQGLHTGPQLPW